MCDKSCFTEKVFLGHSAKKPFNSPKNNEKFGLCLEDEEGKINGKAQETRFKLVWARLLVMELKANEGENFISFPLQDPKKFIP